MDASEISLPFGSFFLWLYDDFWLAELMDLYARMSHKFSGNSSKNVRYLCMWELWDLFSFFFFEKGYLKCLIRSWHEFLLMPCPRGNLTGIDNWPIQLKFQDSSSSFKDKIWERPHFLFITLRLPLKLILFLGTKFSTSRRKSNFFLSNF